MLCKDDNGSGAEIALALKVVVRSPSIGSTSKWAYRSLCFRLFCNLLVGLPAPLVYADSIDVLEYAEPQYAYKVYQYRSIADGAQPWNIEGRLVELPSEPENIGGKHYRTRIQKSEDLPDYFPAESKVYYREHEGGLYNAYYETEDRFSEFLQIPTNVEVGESWHGPSRFWDRETLESIGGFTTPAGKFERCLTIKRTKSMTDPEQKLNSVSVICPGVGGVRSVTTHQMDNLESSTETLLLELRMDQ